jgi:hypothetical protein
MVQVCRWFLIEETKIESQSNIFVQETYGLKSDGEQYLIKKYVPFRIHVNTTSPCNPWHITKSYLYVTYPRLLITMMMKRKIQVTDVWTHMIWIVIKICSTKFTKTPFTKSGWMKLSFTRLKICPRLCRVPCFLFIRLEFSSKSM